MEKPDLNDLDMDKIDVGKVFEFERIITAGDVDKFAELSGDFNPLHCDENFARNTEFKGRVAHGMLIASLFSALVGMRCPGKNCLYLAQSVSFRKPIFPGTKVTVRGTVKYKHDALRIIVINTEIIADGMVVVSGEAKVKVRGDNNRR